MADLILAIDQGTTSSRALIVNRQGEIVSVAQQPIDMIYPHPGWVNQDAMNIWETTLACCREAIATAGINASDIAAIGITNQRETTVVWDPDTLEPLAPAIVCSVTKPLP